MLDFVKRMVEEHSQLLTRTQALHEYIYSEKSNNDNKVEFANKCIQLSYMKKYEEALRARLENQGVFFENGQYFERVAQITVPKDGDENPKDKEKND